MFIILDVVFLNAINIANVILWQEHTLWGHSDCPGERPSSNFRIHRNSLRGGEKKGRSWGSCPQSLACPPPPEAHMVSSLVQVRFNPLDLWGRPSVSPHHGWDFKVKMWFGWFNWKSFGLPSCFFGLETSARIVHCYLVPTQNAAVKRKGFLLLTSAEIGKSPLPRRAEISSEGAPPSFPHGVGGWVA